MTAALASRGSDNQVGEEEGTEREIFRGDGGTRIAVETASIGVQWEEEAGAVTGAPSSSTTGGLPPWAKPYARSFSPPTQAVRGSDGSGRENGERVVMESRGNQCGESVLGGRCSEAALDS